MAKSIKGFTLLEVLLAVTILVIGATYIGQGFIQSLEVVRRADQYLASASLMEQAAVGLQIQTWDGTEPGQVLHTEDLTQPEGLYQFSLEGQDLALDGGMYDYFTLKILLEGKTVGEGGYLAHRGN